MNLGHIQNTAALNGRPVVAVDPPATPERMPDPLPEREPDAPERPKREPVPGTPSHTPEERPGTPGEKPRPVREHPADPEPPQPSGTAHAADVIIH